MRSFLMASLVVSTLALSACDEPCDKSGCKAMDNVQPEDDRSTRLAGFVSYQTDQRVDGCTSCSLTRLGLWIWRRGPEPITDQAAMEALVKTEPLLKHDADKRYRLDLAPGEYVVCAYKSCANITLASQRTTTLNVLMNVAESRFFFAEPGAKVAVELPSVYSGFSIF